ncbi:ABC transporter substrate-binding protein [Rhodospirillum sp. A1_3_36]|uniref:ABC transporter substrate-binding protein n=1 Tax=Rhodospirillum sp. A1_3_36 TaxID=3391666 RepID=UPI0039A54824
MRLTRALTFASALVASAVGLSLPTQAEESHITVLLDWFVNPDHGPLIVAEELGYFKEVGLDVELVAPADPNDPPKLVAAGKAEIAIGYQPQLHVQVAEGLPLVRFGTLVATPLNSLVALKDGPIKDLKDLKGKKVGYSVGGFEDALLGAMLTSEGLSLDDVELVNVNFSLSPAVISGQVDAVIGAFRNFELNQMDIAGHPGVAFYPEEHGVPVYDELIFITATDMRDDPRLAAFLAAVEKGTHYIVNHPQKSWDIFRGHSPDLDDELNKRAWFATIPRFDMTPAALDSGRYARFAEFLKTQGLIKETLPVSSYAIAVGQE